MALKEAPATHAASWEHMATLLDALDRAGRDPRRAVGLSRDDAGDEEVDGDDVRWDEADEHRGRLARLEVILEARMMFGLENDDHDDVGVVSTVEEEEEEEEDEEEEEVEEDSSKAIMLAQPPLPLPSSSSPPAATPASHPIAISPTTSRTATPTVMTSISPSSRAITIASTSPSRSNPIPVTRSGASSHHHPHGTTPTSMTTDRATTRKRGSGAGAGGGVCKGDSLDAYLHLSSDGMIRPWLPTYVSIGDQINRDAKARARLFGREEGRGEMVMDKPIPIQDILNGRGAELDLDPHDLITLKMIDVKFPDEVPIRRFPCGRMRPGERPPSSSTLTHAPANHSGNRGGEDGNGNVRDRIFREHPPPHGRSTRSPSSSPRQTAILLPPPPPPPPATSARGGEGEGQEPPALPLSSAPPLNPTPGTSMSLSDLIALTNSTPTAAGTTAVTSTVPTGRVPLLSTTAEDTTDTSIIDKGLDWLEADPRQGTLEILQSSTDPGRLTLEWRPGKYVPDRPLQKNDKERSSRRPKRSTSSSTTAALASTLASPLSSSLGDTSWALDSPEEWSSDDTASSEDEDEEEVSVFASPSAARNAKWHRPRPTPEWRMVLRDVAPYFPAALENPLVTVRAVPGQPCVAFTTRDGRSEVIWVQDEEPRCRRHHQAPSERRAATPADSPDTTMSCPHRASGIRRARAWAREISALLPPHPLPRLDANDPAMIAKFGEEVLLGPLPYWLVNKVIRPALRPDSAVPLLTPSPPKETIEISSVHSSSPNSMTSTTMTMATLKGKNPTSTITGRRIREGSSLGSGSRSEAKWGMRPDVVTGRRVVAVSSRVPNGPSATNQRLQKHVPLEAPTSGAIIGTESTSTSPSPSIRNPKENKEDADNILTSFNIDLDLDLDRDMKHEMEKEMEKERILEIGGDGWDRQSSTLSSSTLSTMKPKTTSTGLSTDVSFPVRWPPPTSPTPHQVLTSAGMTPELDRSEHIATNPLVPLPTTAIASLLTANGNIIEADVCREEEVVVEEEIAEAIEEEEEEEKEIRAQRVLGHLVETMTMGQGRLEGGRVVPISTVREKEGDHLGVAGAMGLRRPREDGVEEREEEEDAFDFPMVSLRESMIALAQQMAPRLGPCGVGKPGHARVQAMREERARQENQRADLGVVGGESKETQHPTPSQGRSPGSHRKGSAVPLVGWVGDDEHDVVANQKQIVSPSSLSPSLEDLKSRSPERERERESETEDATVMMTDLAMDMEMIMDMDTDVDDMDTHLYVPTHKHHAPTETTTSEPAPLSQYRSCTPDDRDTSTRCTSTETEKETERGTPSSRQHHRRRCHHEHEHHHTEPWSLEARWSDSRDVTDDRSASISTLTSISTMWTEQLHHEIDQVALLSRRDRNDRSDRYEYHRDGEGHGPGEGGGPGMNHEHGGSGGKGMKGLAKESNVRLSLDVVPGQRRSGLDALTAPKMRPDFGSSMPSGRVTVVAEGQRYRDNTKVRVDVGTDRGRGRNRGGGLGQGLGLDLGGLPLEIGREREGGGKQIIPYGSFRVRSGVDYGRACEDDDSSLLFELD